MLLILLDGLIVPVEYSYCLWEITIGRNIGRDFIVEEIRLLVVIADQLMFLGDITNERSNQRNHSTAVVLCVGSSDNSRLWTRVSPINN
jgi:hypothetical protein